MIDSSPRERESGVHIYRLLWQGVGWLLCFRALDGLV